MALEYANEGFQGCANMLTFVAFLLQLNWEFILCLKYLRYGVFDILIQKSSEEEVIAR